MTVARVIHGDTPGALSELADESIDSCVTDPPYGIGFMGKSWDTFKPGAGPKATMNRGDSDNPNVAGRARSPAASPSSVSYDESLTGHRSFQAWTEQWAREVYRVLKPGAHLLCCGAPRSYHRMACGIEDAGFEVRDAVLWIFGQGFPKSHNLKGDKEGWGTALKPAWEPILLARKPFSGTVAENVGRFGTGALNIDACRVETVESIRTVQTPSQNAGTIYGTDQRTRTVFEGHAAGRWPANVIHDGSAEVVAIFPEQAGAAAPVHRRNGDKFRTAYGAFSGDVDEQGSTFQGDTGSAARFFYVPKADRADRDDGCSGFDQRKVHGPSGDGRCWDIPGSKSQPRGNHHPTVKPTDLMRYLCALVTPLGGTILDPFMGSGSTGRGAALGDFGFIGVEREAEYLEIARARIRAISPLFTEVA